MCCLYVYKKITSPCQLKVKGLHVSGEESAEYDLASLTTIPDNKFQVYDDDQQNHPPVEKLSMLIHKAIYKLSQKSFLFHWLILYLNHLCL